MSSPNNVQNGQSSIWSTAVPYITPPLAASFAIVPVFYGFTAKSAQQLGEPIPNIFKIPYGAKFDEVVKCMQMALKTEIKKGIKAAPTIGVIVGTQMIAQNLFEKALMKYNGNQSEPNFASMVFSSIMVGVISAPSLAVFNGQTMNRTVKESLKALSAKQVMAIVSRETCFLFSLRISEPLSKAMKSVSGDNKATEYGSTFASGAIGSLISHPADTALTLWQKDMKVTSFHQSMRGAPIKAITVGSFAIIYKIAKDALESRS